METLKANPYFLGVSLALASYISLFLLNKFLYFQREKILNRNHNRVYDVVIYGFAHTGHLFMIVSSLYLGFQFFPEHDTYPTWSFRIFFMALMWQVCVWGNHLIVRWMQLSFSRRKKRDPASASSISIVELMAKVFLFTVVLIFTLHNLGIQVTTMVAGLGIGGIAVALALQNILGDLFSSLSIILDKPFVVGDFIALNEWLGEVEKIGLKTTRLRSLSGEQIIMSNSDLLSSRIRNYKRMHERRVALVLSLAFSTTAPKLRRAVQIITDSISNRKLVRFERAHFMKFNGASLDIETVYWVLDADYNIHMDIQQEILFDIQEAFRRDGISFALPAHTLFVQPTEVAVRNEHPSRSEVLQRENSFS